MADLGVLRGIFEPYESTLQDTSYDLTNKKYLCQSQEKVINFDKYTQTKAQKSKGNTRKSFDALYFHHETSSVYCIEFKNQRYANIDSVEIREKFTEGICELKQIFESVNVAITHCRFYLFVVFQKPKTENEMNAFHTRFSGNEIFYGLDSKTFKKGLFNVILKSKTGYGAQFEKIYKKLFYHTSNC